MGKEWFLITLMSWSTTISQREQKTKAYKDRMIMWGLFCKWRISQKCDTVICDVMKGFYFLCQEVVFSVACLSTGLQKNY